MLAVGTVYTPKPVRTEQVSVAMFEPEQQKEEEKAEEEKPPEEEKVEPPPPPVQQPSQAEIPAPDDAAAEPEAPGEEAPADTGLGEAYSGLPDLGLMAGPGGGGLAVRTGPAKKAPTQKAPRAEVTKKETELAPAPAAEQCTEAVVKPKPVNTVGVSYAEEARRAEVEGVVRVQITVDETGRIIDTKVVRGLGYGLDEAALAAAKQWTFKPATRCGKPTVGSLTVGMRFTLGG